MQVSVFVFNAFKFVLLLFFIEREIYMWKKILYDMFVATVML